MSFVAGIYKMISACTRLKKCGCVTGCIVLYFLLKTDITFSLTQKPVKGQIAR